MPPRKRKQTTTAKQDSAPPAKQAKQDGQKAVSLDLDIPVDEGYHGQAAKVYIDGDRTIFDASLNQTNISGNNNKFYRLQLLETEAKKNKQYYCHTRWGRVGDFGQIKTMGPESLEEAMKDFEKKFKDKSGLTWEQRGEEPKSKKYTFIERNYDSDDEGGGDVKKEEDDEDDATSDAKVESKLPIQSQRLMELIFNSNHFNSVLENIGYNQDKLPLGKLSKSTIKQGFEHLKELSSLIKHPSLAQNKYKMSREDAIEDFSNKYYSVIPHVFGRNRAPLINNDDILKREVGMLDTLSDMQIANQIMKVPSDKNKDANSVALLDQRFNSLNLEECEPLDHKSSEYKDLQNYLVESSSSGHNLRYRLQDIFRVKRTGEEERFNKWVKTAKLKDSSRKLLWHGSRTTNFGGILSQGLRIAPPEAPVNGYAFGKGVYLADVSSKSAGYCIPGMSGGVGLLLLCEAELGNPMYEIPNGSYNAQEEAEKHNCITTKGVGKTVPQTWKDAGTLQEDLEGVEMPDGPPGDNKNHEGGYLQYNEYIVYNVAQIRLRYLFRVGM